MTHNLESLVDTWTRGCIAGGFSLRSGYYAGRPPSRGDINTNVLEGLYNGISQDIGAEEAVSFVRFVNKLKDMSASSFVVAFARFFHNGCKETDIAQSKDDRTCIDGHGDAGHSQAFAMLATVLAHGKKSEEEILRLSNDVKAEFIRNHLNVIPKADRQKMGRKTYV